MLDLVYALPLELRAGRPADACAHRLQRLAAKHCQYMQLRLNPAGVRSTRFAVTKHVGRFYAVEAAGYLVPRTHDQTVLIGQVRISRHTYRRVLLLALLAILFVFLEPVIGLLFAFVFLRVVMAIVVATRMCREELAAEIRQAIMS